MTSHYLIHTDKRELALEATQTNLMMDRYLPSSTNKDVYGFSLILKIRAASGQLIPFVSKRDGQAGTEFIRKIVENFLRPLVSTFFSIEDPRRELAIRVLYLDEIPSGDYIFTQGDPNTAPKALSEGAFGCIFKMSIHKEMTHKFGGNLVIATKFQIPSDVKEPRLRGEIYAEKRAKD